MQLIQLYSMIGFLFVAGGCGPDSAQESTWMLGTFSNQTVGLQDISAVGHYEFRADGTIVHNGIAQYGDGVLDRKEYAWERHGDDVIEVILSEPIGGADTWRISPLSDECENLRRESLMDGKVIATGTLYRGTVCIQKLAPCPNGSQCPSSMTVWCDEAPPECSGQ